MKTIPEVVVDHDPMAVEFAKLNEYIEYGDSEKVKTEAYYCTGEEHGKIRGTLTVT